MIARRFGAAALLVAAMVLCDAAAGATRVLFVGNSVTYYYGTPYLFEEISADLYGVEIEAYSLVQAGGSLVQAAARQEVLEQLAADPFDIVVLQEWGSLLFCTLDDESDWSRECTESLRAHRALIDVAAGSGATTVLLGTYQLSPEAAAALQDGEAVLRTRAGIDEHVAFASLLLQGRDRYPGLPWLHADGFHPGPAAALLMACRIADQVFDAGRLSGGRLEYLEPRATPAYSLSFARIEAGTAVFRSDDEPSLSRAEIDAILSLCEV